MFAPNVTTHQMADSIHHERQSHAALLHKMSQDRDAGAVSVDREVQRRITSRRLAATLVAATLTFVIAAAAAANQPAAAPSAADSNAAPGHAGSAGGGMTLIR